MITYQDKIAGLYYSLYNKYREMYGACPYIQNKGGKVEVVDMGGRKMGVEVTTNKVCRFTCDARTGFAAEELFDWWLDPRPLTEGEADELYKIALEIIEGGFTG
jgi:hypothetical protein